MKDIKWPLMFEVALESQARLWGGQANIPFPLTADIFEKELFWALADRLDADTFICQGLTIGDTQLVDPTWYLKRRKATEKQLAKHGRKVIEDSWEQQQQEFAAVASPTDAEYKLLVRRLGLFDAQHSDSFDWFGTSSEPGLPWGMDVAKFQELPSGVVNNRVASSRLGIARRLLLTAQLGRLGPAFWSALADRHVPINDEVVKTSGEWAREIFRTERDDIVPWAIGEAGLTWYRFGRPERSPATLVVGDSPWDFTLFYALRRWMSLAWWLPSWLRKDGAYLHGLARDLERLPRQAARDLVVTTTSTPALRDRTVKDLKALPHRSLRPTPATWQEVLPRDPGRYFEYENVGQPTPTLLLENATPPLPTPLPRNVAATEETEMRWITEGRVDDWAPVRSSTALASKLVDAYGYEHGMVRTTRNGVAYLCPHWFTQRGQGLASSTIRPVLRPLGLLAQIQTLVKPHGWTCKLSDKGIYASETVDLFGGLAGACSSLRDAAVRPLLNAYLPNSGAGRFLSQDQRTYTTLRKVQEIVPKDAAGVVERLLAQRVLLRGLILKCERCRQEAWYGLAELDETFDCQRCYRRQRIRQGRWLGGDEPAWAYRLAEVVYQFLVADGDLPLLAVWDQFGNTGRPLEVAHELSFKPPGDAKSNETDMVISHGSDLWLGEATGSGIIDPLDRLDRLQELAELLPAYGVMLATSRASFTAIVRERFNSLFDAPWPKTSIVARVERGPNPLTS